VLSPGNNGQLWGKAEGICKSFLRINKRINKKVLLMRIIDALKWRIFKLINAALIRAHALITALRNYYCAN
jgi:hypothetical protein